MKHNSSITKHNSSPYHAAPLRSLLSILVLAGATALAAAQESQLPISSVTATTNDGNVPANTLDGSLSTRWSAKGDGQTIFYDLGSVQTVTSVQIAWYEGSDRVAKFDIGTSLDASNWTSVFSGSSSGVTNDLERYDVTDSAARYVCIIGHDNSQNLWNSITDVKIFGLAATNQPPGVTNPPPPTATGPAGLIDLTNWKLTLPVDTSHPGKPDEILQPELSTFTDAYFAVNPTHDGVVFTAPCGGYTTSGSGYPRSELREMASNGQTAASWSTTSGTHTMVITQAITHLPVVKPQVVAGQIHGPSDDLTVFRLEGQHLFIDLNGTTGPTLTSSYNLGDIFTVAFVAHNGGVDYYYNGQFIYTYKTSASGCYFKTGCYTQSNTSKGDAATAYGEVVVYGVSVTHQ